MARDYTQQIAEFWPTIMRAWHEHADKLPVIECDIVARKVLAYPAKEYLGDLTARTREAARRQYRGACAAGGIMVFIRDTARRVLQSQVYVPDRRAERKPKPAVRRAAAGQRRSDGGPTTPVPAGSRRRSVT